ncbi:cysteine dioxygenase [Streptomyces roseifaciens]|uniref:cysteine dioxygenase n=1 Tax=Streptomyces roseifaciens TaxID=1488406 RepID=UPI0007182B3B|nr:cysteine dioxygenase family protein [Streptomyces roseifaciens]
MNSDVQIAGDPLAIPHLLPPAPAHPRTVAEFAGLARAVAADRASWAHLVRYDATTRWYHRLRTGPGYEVWLLSWVPGQGSGAHDHGPSSGVLTVLEGELTEITGSTGPLDGARQVLRAGAQRVFAPGYAHEIVNDSLAPAVSLHVYSPGLTEMPMRRPASAAGRPVAAPALTAAPAGLDAVRG